MAAGTSNGNSGSDTMAWTCLAVHSDVSEQIRRKAIEGDERARVLGAFMESPAVSGTVK